MARIRTIKPEFWLDEDLSELSPEEHLFAAALLNHCDDEGYFKANPKLLHAQIFALRDLSGTVPVFVQSLQNIGYLRTFTGSDGKNYGHVINFKKHQSINKAKPSQIKGLEGTPEESGTDTGALPVGKERKGKEQGKELIKDLSSKHDDDANKIFQFWCTTMDKQKSAFSDGRKKKIIDRLADGYTVEEIKVAITNCSNTPHNMGHNSNQKQYNCIELICRSTEKLESFRDNPGTLNAPTHNHANSEAAKRFLQDSDQPEHPPEQPV